MFLGAAMTEVHCNLFVPHVVDESNRLVTEQLIGMPLEILGDSLGGYLLQSSASSSSDSSVAVV